MIKNSEVTMKKIKLKQGSSLFTVLNFVNFISSGKYSQDGLYKRLGRYMRVGTEYDIILATLIIK